MVQPPTRGFGHEPEKGPPAPLASPAPPKPPPATPQQARAQSLLSLFGAVVAFALGLIVALHGFIHR